MFSEALNITTKFTLPVIFTRRLRKGQLTASLGSFVVVNDEGWFVTADHIVADLLRFGESQDEIQKYEAAKQRIEADPTVKDKDKRRMIQRLNVSDEWIMNQAVFWGHDGWSVDQFFRDPLADVAIGRIKGFDASTISQYPVFKNPAVDFKTGTSLCRLGFPFHEIKSTFDVGTGLFSLDPATFPVPLFPNDGILTRFFIKDASDHSRQVRFVETSSAGLRGQSGGPIFDRDAKIYAIQSQTISLPLGFTPTIKLGNKEIVEHQFMHLGWGSHIANVISLLTANGVPFAMD